VLRGRVLDRVLDGLKHRLLAPKLVEAFVREFVAEVNAANRESGQQQVRLQQEQTKIGRQIRNLLELIKDGHGSAGMVRELRELEQRRETLEAGIVSAGVAELAPMLHPNLPELYRRKVEMLEKALQDPATASAAGEALRGLIDAIVVFPGAKRGEVMIELRGDLAAFMHVEDEGASTRTAVPRVGNGRSVEVMGSLVAGIGFEPMTFRL
jgi:site-specific DNA recombinase